MTSMTSGGRKKCHYTLPDDSEVVEEYDVQTDALMVRKRRCKTILGAQGEWVYEIGEAPARVTIENDTLRASSSNPVLVRKDRPKHSQQQPTSKSRGQRMERGEALLLLATWEWRPAEGRVGDMVSLSGE